MRRAAAQNHPELFLPLPPKPGDDPRLSLLQPLEDLLIRKILRDCPGIATHESETGFRLRGLPLNQEQRRVWSGRNLIPARHQIVLNRLPTEEIKEQHKAISNLAHQASLPPTLATVLYGRGCTGPKAAQEFVTPDIERELSRLPIYATLENAASILAAAIREELRITIVADYDADGNCSAAIMKRAIDACGGFCTVIQPDRVRDGYGLSNSTLERVKKAVPNVVVTLDLGTSNRPQIQALNSLGVTTIVVDHHELQGAKTATPYLLVNPKSDPTLKGYEGLCASGLSWLVARSLLSHTYQGESLSAHVNELLPLAAIGTVADVMELSGLNRAIAWHGHALLPKSKIPALRALSQIKRDGKITGDFVGYHIGPALNACGRIYPAEKDTSGTAPVFTFLTTDDHGHAESLYSILVKVNAERKSLERAGLEEAQKLVNKYVKDKIPVHCGVVLPIDGVHEGVVGLIAARLCESLQCPVIALTHDKDGNWKGSGRSTPQVSLITLLRHPELTELIDEFGGHDAAAGLRIKADKVQEFQKRFNRICTEIFCSPAAVSPSGTASAPTYIPPVKKWYKEYRPDLIMTVQEYVARQQELAKLCSTLEPCGRGNAPLSILLPRVRISQSRETPSKHRYVTLQNVNPAGIAPHEQHSLEVFAFARSLASRILEHRQGPDQVFDVIIQPSVDNSVATIGNGLALKGNLLLLQPSVFPCEHPRNPERKEQKFPLKALALPQKNAHQLSLDKELPLAFPSIEAFCNHFGITCLRTDALRLIPKQLQFITELFTTHEKNAHCNVLYKVNTGGGKTIIAFFKLAQILSRNPNAKVLYLAPQNDLVEQTLRSAQAVFNLREDEIVTLSGETSARDRKELYRSSARLFIGTPHTLKNDGDLSGFDFVILDEIHYMRGDSPESEDTRYPYRWVVEQIHTLAEKGHPIRFWAQSGTPATTRELLAQLTKTLDAVYLRAHIPTGSHTWKPSEVELDEEYRLHLISLRDGYRAALRELLSLLPKWSCNRQFDSALSPIRKAFKQAVLAFFDIHQPTSSDQTPSAPTLPSRKEFKAARETLLKQLKEALKRAKKRNAQAVNDAEKKDVRWIYSAISRLHELDHALRCFEDLRSKGRSALTLSLSPRIVDILYPPEKHATDHKSSSSAAASAKPIPFGQYHVRFLRRPEIQQTLEWVMEENTPARILKEFRKIYPKTHSLQSAANDSFRYPSTSPIRWQSLLNYTTADDLTSKKKKTSQAIREAALQTSLLQELLSSTRIDCKERFLRRLLHTLPEDAKIMIQCDEKIETKLLSERLRANGLKAAWYAGKSVPKREKLKDNLEAFRNGTVRILCCTSVGDTGHDIPSVTHSIRIVPLTSPIRNAQSRGRTARKEGLQGTYITMIVNDPDGDFDERRKYIIARQRERTMNKT
jgi:single-stranded-DNA-specific exonuclease